MALLPFTLASLIGRGLRFFLVAGLMAWGGARIEKALYRYIAQHADLIVMGQHGKSGLEGWLLGSVSKDVSQTAQCDVLIMSLYGTCSDLTLYRCMAGTDS